MTVRSVEDWAPTPSSRVSHRGPVHRHVYARRGRSRAAAPGVFMALVLGVALSACGDATAPAGDAGATVALGIAPRFHSAGAVVEGRITGVRILARDAAADTLLGRLEEALDPDAPSWSLSVNVARGGPRTTYVLSVELIDHADTVLWSGRSLPITLGPDQAGEQARVDVYPGPLANLDVREVALSVARERVTEGDTVPVEARVDGGGQGVRVFLASLDTSLAVVDSSGSVRTRRPGTARIVAHVGPATDTLALLIHPWPLPPPQDVAAFALALDDVSTRLVAGLRDAAGAQAISEALGDLATALARGRGPEAAEAGHRARAALAAYGAGGARAGDAPDLGAIELVLLHAERLLSPGPS